MKKASFLYLVLLTCLSNFLFAQTLSPTVISSSGGFYSVGGNSISFTIGEMTMVQTFMQPSNILTQGFQQPEQLTTSVAENEVVQGEIIIYPNPNNGQFNIGYSALNQGDCQAILYNMAGQIILKQSYNAIFGANVFSLDIAGIRQGIYMLTFRTIDQNGKQKITFHKINLAY